MNCTKWEKIEDGKILLIRLNRPKANILDAEMIKELVAGLKEFVNKHTRSVLISQEGPHFSFGASVEEHTKENAHSMLKEFHGLFRLIHDISLPFIAAVKGNCLGGGLALASFCHSLFSHPDSKFGQPEINLGVFPPMASIIFNIKSPAVADEINVTGRILSAEEYNSYGLVTSLDENPEQKAVEFAKKHFLQKSASSIRQAVKANRWRFDDALTNILPQLEKQYLNDLMETDDANEGINSFLEKRKPQWNDQ